MPGKYLGQNFLYDPFLIKKIVDASGVGKDDTVIEIGPGPGRMTRVLAERVGRLIAIELDRDLYHKLIPEFAGMDHVGIVHEDALKFPYENVGEFKVVANIPYYITTPIIFRLLDARKTLKSMTLTIQKEVAERIVAKPGGKDYGVLSIMVQYYARTEMKFIIRKQSFRPVPRVDSAVLHAEVLARPPVSVRDEKLLFRLVRESFGHRRKTLSNSLKEMHPEIKQVLISAGIDPGRRPETLSIEEFARIADVLSTGSI